MSLSKKFKLLFAIGMFGFNSIVWLRYFKAFTALPLTTRVAIFNSWAYSSIPLQRQLFKLIRSTALLAFYEHPAVIRPARDRGLADAWRRTEGGRGAPGDPRAGSHRGGAKVLGSAGVGFETVTEYGEAHEAIARVADGRKCTSVVMGTRGQGVLRSSLMGSVGMRVLHLVKVPVTFVP